MGKEGGKGGRKEGRKGGRKGGREGGLTSLVRANVSHAAQGLQSRETSNNGTGIGHLLHT
jgi:hypothetical protein